MKIFTSIFFLLPLTAKVCHGLIQVKHLDAHDDGSINAQGVFKRSKSSIKTNLRRTMEDARKDASSESGTDKNTNVKSIFLIVGAGIVCILNFWSVCEQMPEDHQEYHQEYNYRRIFIKVIAAISAIAYCTFVTGGFLNIRIIFCAASTKPILLAFLFSFGWSVGSILLEKVCVLAGLGIGFNLTMGITMLASLLYLLHDGTREVIIISASVVVAIALCSLIYRVYNNISEMLRRVKILVYSILSGLLLGFSMKYALMFGHEATDFIQFDEVIVTFAISIECALSICLSLWELGGLVAPQMSWKHLIYALPTSIAWVSHFHLYLSAIKMLPKVVADRIALPTFCVTTVIMSSLWSRFFSNEWSQENKMLVLGLILLLIGESVSMAS